jgi:hypothetical protein
MTFFGGYFWGILSSPNDMVQIISKVRKRLEVPMRKSKGSI